MTPQFIQENMMGPNVILILDEMLPALNVSPDMKILDLGCGRGLSSIHLAQKTKTHIIAFDLWIDANDNAGRFKQNDVEEHIFPVHGDILQKPFAHECFDMLISIDAYHYFGRNETVLDEHIAPLVKKGGKIALAFPGMKKDFNGDYPPEMLLSWTSEDLDTMRSIRYWKRIFSASAKTKTLFVREMDCYEQSWQDWLATDNPYAKGDSKAMNAGADEHMNFIFALLERI